MTYKEAYDKIIQAYFKDEIKPFDNQFCFCGTLSPNKNWRSSLLDNGYPYSVIEYLSMEDALFGGMSEVVQHEFSACTDINYAEHILRDSGLREDAIFSGMCGALDVLKEIHRSRGEDVDEELTPFTKRNLTQIR